MPNSRYDNWGAYDLSSHMTSLKDMGEKKRFYNSLPERKRDQLEKFSEASQLTDEFARIREAKGQEAALDFYRNLPSEGKDLVDMAASITKSSFQLAEQMGTQHPDLGTVDRVMINMFNDSPEDQAKQIRNRYGEQIQAKVIDGELMLKSPGSGKAYGLEKDYSAPGLNLETLKDMAEGSTTLAKGIAETYGATKGAIGGAAFGNAAASGPVGKFAAGASGLAFGGGASAGLADYLTQELGKRLGYRDDINVDQIKQNTMMGGVLAPLLGPGRLGLKQVNKAYDMSEAIQKLPGIGKFFKGRGGAITERNMDFGAAARRRIGGRFGSIFGKSTAQDKHEGRNFLWDILADEKKARDSGKDVAGQRKIFSGNVDVERYDPILQQGGEFREIATKSIQDSRTQIGKTIHSGIDSLGGVSLDRVKGVLDKKIAKLLKTARRNIYSKAIREKITSLRAFRDSIFQDLGDGSAYRDAVEDFLTDKKITDDQWANFKFNGEIPKFNSDVSSEFERYITHVLPEGTKEKIIQSQGIDGGVVPWKGADVNTLPSPDANIARWRGGAKDALPTAERPLTNWRGGPRDALPTAERGVGKAEDLGPIHIQGGRGHGLPPGPTPANIDKRYPDQESIFMRQGRGLGLPPGADQMSFDGPVKSGFQGHEGQKFFGDYVLFVKDKLAEQEKDLNKLSATPQYVGVQQDMIKEMKGELNNAVKSKAYESGEEQGKKLVKAYDDYGLISDFQKSLENDGYIRNGKDFNAAVLTPDERKLGVTRKDQLAAVRVARGQSKDVIDQYARKLKELVEDGSVIPTENNLISEATNLTKRRKKLSAYGKWYDRDLTSVPIGMRSTDKGSLMAPVLSTMTAAGGIISSNMTNNPMGPFAAALGTGVALGTASQIPRVARNTMKYSDLFRTSIGGGARMPVQVAKRLYAQEKMRKGETLPQYVPTQMGGQSEWGTDFGNYAQGTGEHLKEMLINRLLPQEGDK